MADATALKAPPATREMTRWETLAQFLFLEARLLDEADYEGWRDLFTEDCLYWVPVDRDAQDPARSLSHFCDDKQLLSARVHRLLVPRVNEPEPPAKTVHSVSNILPQGTDETGAEIVKSSLVVYEWRERGYTEGNQRSYAALCTHHLVAEGERFRIRRKRVDLVNSEGSLSAVTVPF